MYSTTKLSVISILGLIPVKREEGKRILISRFMYNGRKKIRVKKQYRPIYIKRTEDHYCTLPT